jgi:prevent-host-death family protein
VEVEIAAGKFKAECLKLMDRVKKNRERIIITKRGQPVAQLVPVDEEQPQDIFGALRGLVLEEEDILSPVGETWEAEAGES